MMFLPVCTSPTKLILFSPGRLIGMSGLVYEPMKPTRRIVPSLPAQSALLPRP